MVAIQLHGGMVAIQEILEVKTVWVQRSASASVSPRQKTDQRSIDYILLIS